MAFKYPFERSVVEKPTEYCELVVALRDYLQARDIISRVEYVGSAFKGTRIDSSDFDNLFVLRSEDIIARPTKSWLHARLRSDDRIGIMPLPTRDTFKGQLQKAVNELEDSLDANITLVDNGPAIALKYTSNNVSFSVDVDLCYEVRDRKGRYQMFVPKPPNRAGQQDLWKLTTDVQEKEKISTIDDGNGVGRQAVRILKSVKKSECGLASLKSCMFEHVLYYLKDRHQDKAFWLAPNMDTILKEMIGFIRSAVKRGKLPNYFVHEESLLPKMKPLKKENYLNRLAKFEANVQRVYTIGKMSELKL